MGRLNDVLLADSVVLDSVTLAIQMHADVRWLRRLIQAVDRSGR